MTSQNILYRAFAQDGTLLYVGASTSFGLRLTAHSLEQPWFNEVANITLERFATYEELLSEEADAIQTEGPRYNVIYGTARPRNPSGARRTKGDGALFQRRDGLWIGRVEIPPARGSCKRRHKYVSSKDHATAQLKLEELRKSL